MIYIIIYFLIGLVLGTILTLKEKDGLIGTMMFFCWPVFLPVFLVTLFFELFENRR